MTTKRNPRSIAQSLYDRYGHTGVIYTGEIQAQTYRQHDRALHLAGVSETLYPDLYWDIEVEELIQNMGLHIRPGTGGRGNV